jgi:hypothetical protein
VALADHDEGMVASAAGEHARAAELLGRALDGEARVNRPLVRLLLAEEHARLHRADAAEAALRDVTAEPVLPGDRPGVLVARMSHVQGLVALARGDRALARRRLEESAAAWRRHSAARQGREQARSLVDLGRPGLAPVEPARELARIARDLEECEPTEGVVHARVR